MKMRKIPNGVEFEPPATDPPAGNAAYLNPPRAKGTGEITISFPETVAYCPACGENSVVPVYCVSPGFQWSFQCVCGSTWSVEMCYRLMRSSPDSGERGEE